MHLVEVVDHHDRAGGGRVTAVFELGDIAEHVVEGIEVPAVVIGEVEGGCKGGMEVAVVQDAASSSWTTYPARPSSRPARRSASLSGTRCTNPFWRSW